MDWKLELIVVPVADVDRAKAFYADRLGFKVEVDTTMGEDFRVVQLTPSGSRCSIALLHAPGSAGEVQGAPGSLKGLHLVVTDIEAAREQLVTAGVEVGEIFHMEGGQQAAGPDPQRGDYNSFLPFSDPDGNMWLVQERKKDPYADAAANA